jgi:mono/diheme cytochrome c family protein
MNNRLPTIIRLCIITLLLIVLSFLQFGIRQNSTVQLAVAKGSAMLEMISLPSVPVNSDHLQSVTLQNPAINALTSEKNVEFVNAVPLTFGEAKPWREAGCGQNSCAHVTFYNHTDGGTVNAVVHLERNAVVGSWVDTAVRPAGSTHILQRAMDIAASDRGVTAVLGDIGDADPAMVPMSAWLADNECRNDWCVDLSFLDPAGSGKIYHIFVNMTRNEVARTFYTRGRPILDVPEPVMQRGAFSDGCHEQYGWNVCWEMTAHDGINFRDATYNGIDIFSSIKITQIEAWYPSWPGGYRDEVGFNASVPPFDGTIVTDLNNGFEVRQLFTEFTRWPNCICCYRYEEILRFFADGTLETEFVSHGPGCDDLSIYRPFWRIDLDINGGSGDTAWVWQDNAWQSVEQEQELYPLVEEIAPTGDKVIVNSGNLNYHISMARTDPLGLDEARFFILKDNEGEGDGPIVTGPGDTFQPPRQWLNEEAISDEDLVFWYVPLLKTKKGGPWWCIPDPEPGINECEAILRFALGNGPHQPTAEELAAIPTSTVTPIPAPTNTPAPTPTPRPVEGESAEEVILNAGCGACHAIGVFGEGGKVGPDLSAIAATAVERIPGMSAEAYIRESILTPNAFIPTVCPNSDCFANIMPADYGTRLSANQIDTIVDYLLTQDETVITPEIIGEASDTVLFGKGSVGKQGGTVGVYAPSKQALGVQMALLIIAFVLTMVVVLKQRP